MGSVSERLGEVGRDTCFFVFWRGVRGVTCERSHSVNDSIVVSYATALCSTGGRQDPSVYMRNNEHLDYVDHVVKMLMPLLSCLACIIKSEGEEKKYASDLPKYTDI